MLLIFKTLVRNKGSYLLMTTQIAITLAVLVNALALVKRSQEIIEEPTGMNANLVAIFVVPFDQAFNDESYWQAEHNADLEMFRTHPGVVAASVSNSFPGDFGSNSTITRAGDENSPGINSGIFHADEHMMRTLDVDIIAGRNFRKEEIFFSNWPQADKTLPQTIILTRAAADRLFPDGDALGKAVETSGTTRTIVGITDTFRGRNGLIGPAEVNAFIPGYISGTRQPSSYMIRAEPGETERLMKDLPRKLLERNDGRDVEDVRLVSELISRGNGLYTYGGIVLMVMSGLLVFTTALGIFGVAFFSVNKRRRQIGVRRALGATRVEIMKHFLIENLLTTGTGVMVGSMIAIALNMVMTQLGLGRIDWIVTVTGVVFVLLVGQASVLIPAYKASLIEPAIATRI